MTKAAFFSKDRKFYKAMFTMLAVVAMQNIVAYSVNMADNIMLGSYSQEALSGAATVNQIFFIVQQFAISFGNALVALSAQYWGEKRVGPIRNLAGITLKVALSVSVVIVAVCLIFPEGMVAIFTNEPAIIEEGRKYILIIAWTFLLYIITNVLMAALRAVGTVNISFYISAISLVINVGINYCLIFGKFGLPRLGIVGAAIGTLIARIVELIIVIVYIAKFDKKLNLFHKDILVGNKLLWKDFRRVYIPIMCASVLWGFSVPVQTAVLGHMSADAIAANSVATTFYQYLKVIVVAMSSTSAVMIGNSIGEGSLEEVKAKARSLSVLCVVIGTVLGVLLLVLKDPLLSLYTLNSSAMVMASNLIMIMAGIMVTMSYQMPVSFGIIQGGGDPDFTMKMNLISTWLIVMPLTFMSAYWWKWPVEAVVVMVQSDQIFKCLPVFIHFRKYKWIKKMTREDV